MEQILFRTQPLKNLRNITLKPFCGNSQNLLRPCDKFMSNFSKKTFGFRVLNNLAQHAEWPVFSLSKITPPYWATLCAKRTIEAATPVYTVCDGLPMSYTNHARIYDIWRVNVAPPWIRTICQCVCWQWPPTQFPGPLFALFWRYCPRHNGVLLTCSYSMYMHFVSGAGWMSVWVGGITQARTFS